MPEQTGAAAAAPPEHTGVAVELAEFESDFTWQDTGVDDDAETLFFGSAKMK